MDVDWAIALGIFLIFISWAFVFYTQVFTIGEATAESALDAIADKLMDNLSVGVEVIPVVFTADDADSDKVLYFEYRWPFGKNTTKVFMDGTSQSCNITGDTLYWQSSVSAEKNYFSVQYADQAANLSCTGGFSVVNETQVIPFSAETTSKISLAHINAMNATAYDTFRDQLDIERDFNITIENASGSVVSYGLQPPLFSNVFSKLLLRDLEETNGNVTIRILTW